MDDAGDLQRRHEGQEWALGLVGRGIVDTGMVGAIEDEPDTGIGRLRHVRIADPEEERRPAVRLNRKMLFEHLDVAGFETIVDDGDLAIALADLADRPGLPRQWPGEGRTDTGIDRLVIRMRIRMEIDDPQSKFPRIALGIAKRSLRPEASCP